MLQTLIPLLAIGGFIGFWCLVVKLISFAGWNRLAASFAYELDRPEGERFNFSNITVGRNARYNGCINYTVAGEGLHIKVSLPFRFAHPPLLIPWSRIIDVKPIQRFGFSIYEVEIEAESGSVRIRIPEKVLIASKNAIVNVLR